MHIWSDYRQLGGKHHSRPLGRNEFAFRGPEGRWANGSANSIFFAYLVCGLLNLSIGTGHGRGSSWFTDRVITRGCNRPSCRITSCLDSSSGCLSIVSIPFPSHSVRFGLFYLSLFFHLRSYSRERCNLIAILSPSTTLKRSPGISQSWID